MRPSSFWSGFSTVWVFTSLTLAGYKVAQFFPLWKEVGASIIAIYTVCLGSALGYRGFMAVMESKKNDPG